MFTVFFGGSADFADAQATSADLSVTLSDSPDPVNPGQQFNYQISVRNNGPDPAVNIVADLPMPTGVVLQVVASGAEWDCTSSTPSHVICRRSGTVNSGTTLSSIT